MVDKALVFFKRPAVVAQGSPAWYEETEFSLDLATSRRLVEALLALLWAKSFHRHYLDASYQRALECLFEASKRCLEADNELYDCAFPGSPRIDDWIILEKGGPAILSAGAGFQLIAYTVPAQKAVEAFDHLTTDSPVDINWDEVPIWCMAISDIWEEPTPNPDVRSNTSRFHHTARDFWVMAHGIALQKMTPDALVRALEASKAADSEKRLSMYFFPGLWNSLPEKARKALISADREYEHLHSRRPIIFDHLRHAARAIIDERLWIPFQAFLRSKGSLHSDLGEAARDEPDLSRMLDNWASPEFEGYLVNRYRTQDVSYIRNLQWPLRRLNYLANTASHEHWRGLGEFEQALREGYAKFLGIGQLGILPKLVRLLAYGRVHEPRIP